MGPEPALWPEILRHARHVFPPALASIALERWAEVKPPQNMSVHEYPMGALLHPCRQEVSIAEIESKVDEFTKWQERQNGSLQRIETKVDRLFFAVLGASLTTIAALVIVLIESQSLGF